MYVFIYIYIYIYISITFAGFPGGEVVAHAGEGLGWLFRLYGSRSHVYENLFLRFKIVAQFIACASRQISRRILELGVVQFGTVFDLRITASQKFEAVPKRIRIKCA